MADAKDMDHKYAWLLARVNTIKCAIVLKHFDNSINESRIQSIRTGMKEWVTGQAEINSEHFRLWFEAAKNKLEFASSAEFAVFVSLGFEDWLQKYPEGIRALVSPDQLNGKLKHVREWSFQPPPSEESDSSSTGRLDSDDCRVHVIVDPDHHRVDLTKNWISDGMIDQRFMYLSPYSVSYWQKVIGSGDYPTFQRCLHTLEKTLSHETLRDMMLPVILGTGAHIKEELILKAAANNCSFNKCEAVYCDASFYMLMNSYRELQKNTRDHVNIKLYCLDFLSLDSWQRNVDLPDKKSAFFLLGNTVGNLDETLLHIIIDNVFRKNDILVIGGEFFESEEDILDMKAELEKRYSEDSVIDLVMSGINDYLSDSAFDLSKSQRRKLIEVELKNSKKMARSKLRSNIKGTQSICFELKESIQIGELMLPKGLNLGTSKRYVLDNFVGSMCESCDMIHLDTVTHSTDRYQHIIFQKK